jgi:hypothetical protein
MKRSTFIGGLAAFAIAASVPINSWAHGGGGGGGGMGGGHGGMGGGHGGMGGHFGTSHGMGGRGFGHFGDHRFAFRHDHDFRHDHFRHDRRFDDFDFFGFGFPYAYDWYPYYYPYDYAYYDYDGYDPSDDFEYWNSLAISVQSKLAQYGYFHGPADGVIGPSSRQAIRTFQAADKLPVTGRIDPKLLKALGIGYRSA